MVITNMSRTKLSFIIMENLFQHVLKQCYKWGWVTRKCWKILYTYQETDYGQINSYGIRISIYMPSTPQIVGRESNQEFSHVKMMLIVSLCCLTFSCWNELRNIILNRMCPAKVAVKISPFYIENEGSF